MFYAQCSAEHLQLFQLLLYSQCSLEFFSIVQYSTVHWKISEWLQESHLWHLLQIWNINSWDVTFNPLLFWIAPGLISCIFIWINKKKKSVWYNLFQGTSVSLYFFIFLSIINFGWWIVKLKGSSFQRHQKCVCGTLKSGTVTILS